MQRRTRRIIMGVALIAALAAGGAAFTATIGGSGLSNFDLGAKSVTVNGGTVDAFQYNLSSDKQYVDGLEMDIPSSLSASDTVQVGFASSGSAPSAWTTCSRGAANSGFGSYTTDLLYTCSFGTQDAGQAVAGADNLDVSISDTTQQY